jgi:hypothetical protein
MAQVVEHLPSKHEAPISNSITAKKKKKKTFILFDAIRVGNCFLNFILRLLAPSTEKNTHTHPTRNSVDFFGGRVRKGYKLEILLPHSLNCWDYRHVQPNLAFN